MSFSQSVSVLSFGKSIKIRLRNFLRGITHLQKVWIHVSLHISFGCKTECRLDNPFLNKPWFFTCVKYMPFENTVGKEEIARNEQFLLSYTVFYPFEELYDDFH